MSQLSSSERPELSEAETYLRENDGNIRVFVEHQIAGFPIGKCFANALRTADIYELRLAGVYDIVSSETELDSPRILEAITYLKEQFS